MLKKLGMLVAVARSSTQPVSPSRRDRRRQETLYDIKATARRQLSLGGPSAISLRAIARDLGMTASAVHYYFPSRQALLDAIVVDGFNSLADALQASYEGSGDQAPDDRWVAVCRAHRAWAVRQPAEYLLLYGHTGSVARPANPKAFQAMSRVAAVLFALMREAVANGDVDTGRIEEATPGPLRRQFPTWRDETDVIGDLPEGAVAACMIGYAQLHGAITLELVGNVPPQLTDREALFDFRMMHIATSLHPRN